MCEVEWPKYLLISMATMKRSYFPEVEMATSDIERIERYMKELETVAEVDDSYMYKVGMKFKVYGR